MKDPVKLINQNFETLRKNYEKEIEKLLFKINTNFVEYVPNIVSEKVKNIYKEKVIGLKTITPMVTPTAISTKDLAKIQCSVPNRSMKADVICEIIRYHLKDEYKDDIIIILDSSVYFGEDAIKIERFIIDNYKSDSYLISLLNDTGSVSEIDINNHVLDAIGICKQTGKRNIIIASDPISNLLAFQKMDAIMIDARGNMISIFNKYIITLEDFISDVKCNRSNNYTITGTRDDLMRWSYKISTSLDSVLALAKRKATDPSSTKLMEEFIMSVYKIDDINIDDYGTMLIFNIPVMGGYIRIGISDNDDLSNKNVKYYDLDLRYIKYSKSYKEKEDIPKKEVEEVKECKLKPEGPKTTNTVMNKKEDKGLGMNPLESIYASLLQEYIKLTEESPKEYDNRKALIQMIKDTKSIL